MKKMFSFQEKNTRYSVPWLFLLFLFTSYHGLGQTITTTLNNNNGSSVVVFSFQNNNSDPVVITDIGSVAGVTNTYTAHLYALPTTYNAAPGAAPAITSGNGWVNVGSNPSVSLTANTSTSTATSLITGMSYVVPGNTQVRLALQLVTGANQPAFTTTAGSLRYSDVGTQQDTWSASGCDIRLGASHGYGGTMASPINTPRGFIGFLSFIPSTPCAGVPNGGTATTNSASTCQGANVTLGLNGSTIASGIFYQWFQSQDNISFNPIAGATTSNYIATVAFTGANYYRCIVTCSNSGQSANSVSVLVNGNPQLSGTYTINNTLPTGGTNFNNFQDAFAALQCGSNGTVTMNVSAGQTFTSTGPLVANFTGSLAAPIIFQKSGVGANPSISFTGTSGTADAGLRLNGSDFITWDGINIVQGGTSTADWIEYGVYITKSTATDGASNNTLRNFTIDLGASTATTLRGVFMDNVVAATSSSGASNNNIFQNLTINNVNSAGLWLSGSGTAGNQDLNNQIDGCNITIKSAAAVMYGVYINNQDNFEVKNNTMGNATLASTSSTSLIYITGGTATTNGVIRNNIIENVNNSSAGILYGIQVFNGGTYNVFQNTIRNLTSATTVRGVFLNGVAATTTDLHRNRIYGINCTTTTTPYAAGIQSGPGVNRIYNNMITGITANASTAVPGVRGIDVTAGASQQIYNNTVIVGGSSSSSAALAWSTTTIQLDVRNNVFVNNSSSSAFAAAMYRSTAGNPNFATGSGNNLYYAGVPSATRPIYRNATNSVNDLASYLALGVETVGYTEDVQYSLSNGVVTINQAIPTFIESGGQNLALVTNDYFGTTRGAYPLIGQQPGGGIATDVGAEENNFLINAPMGVPDCATLDTPADNLTDVCPSNVMTLDWTPAISGPIPTNGYDVFFGTTNPPPFVANVSVTNYVVNSLTSGQTYYWKIEPKNGAGNATGCSVFSFSTANHAITSTTPNSICGVGTTQLQATASGGTVTWFANPTGGAPLGTGNTFTTPTISSTTTYYAAAVIGGGNTNVGLTSTAGATSGVGTTNFGLVFDVLAPFTLQQVTIYPVSATNSSGTVTVDVIDGNSTILHTATFNVVGSPSGVNPVTLNLNFNMLPGTNLKLRPGSFSGISGLNFGPSAAAPPGGNYGYPFVVPGVLSINHSTLTAAPTNTQRLDLYYYFYNWLISTGCESSRVPVVATVTTADAISITPSAVTSCPGDAVSLAASSANSNYTYTWMPGNLSGANVSVNPTSTTTYTVTGTDGVCTAQQQVTVTVNGASLGTMSANADICAGSQTTLTITGSVGNIQWQSFNGTWNDIVGQNGTSLTVSPGVTTQYRVALGFAGCPLLFSNPVTVNVTNVETPTVQGGTVCGQGTVNLSASVGQGTINWWANPTGGTPLATGPNFTTPSLNTTTTYYASNIDGGSTFAGGRLAPNVSTGVNLPNYLQQFTINQTITLNSVQVFSTTGTAVTISLYNSTGTNLIVSTGSVPVVAGSSPDINLGWVIPAGTYRLGAVSMTGNFIRENPASPGFSYPIPLGTVGQITGYNTSLTGTLTSSANIYYFVYNWNISTGCESPRVPVTATVTPADAVTITPSTLTSCTGEQVTLSASSANTNYAYTWMPGNLVGATVNVNPIANTTYTVTATDGICTTQQQVSITVNGAVVGTITPSASICAGDQTTITTSGVVGNIQWQSFNGTWNDIIGQNSPSLTVSPSATTQYRAAIGFTGCPLVFSDVVTITVNNPQVVAVQGQTICGAGQVTVTATPSAGATIEWFDAPTGGNSLGTGNTYTTNIAASTTFYAQAATGQGSTNVGLTNTTGATSGAGTTNFGIVFNALSAFTLQQVTIYPVSSTAGGSGTVTIDVIDGNNTILHTATFNVLGYPGGTVPVTVDLNFNIAPGTNLKIRPGARTGAISGLLFGPSAAAPPGGNYGYPFTIPGVVSLIHSTLTAAPVNTQRLDLYYYFYNWVVSTGCESPRVPVQATVTNICTLTQLQSNFCNISGVTMDMPLRAINVNAPAYRFRITGANNGGQGWSGNTFILDRPSRDFKFAQVPGSLWGTTYVVEVAVGDGFGNFGPYGAACNVTMTGIPTTQLEATSCNIVNVDPNTNLLAITVTSATGYRYRVNGANVNNVVVTKTMGGGEMRKLKMNQVAGVMQGETYSVEVAIRDAAGNWGAYGNACDITVAGAPDLVINDNIEMIQTKDLSEVGFGVSASHNPFTTTFALQLTNANDTETINVSIYDMSGKLIERHAINPMDIEAAQFGSNLASGMYMVEVRQGSNQALVRQVKN